MSKKIEIRIGMRGSCSGTKQRGFSIGKDKFVVQTVRVKKKGSASLRKRCCHFLVVQKRNKLFVHRLDYTPSRTSPNNKELQTNEVWERRNGHQKGKKLAGKIRKTIRFMMEELAMAGRASWLSRVGA